MPAFFCDAHSPWQRPGNENTSGLPRQYFPKDTGLRARSIGGLALAATELNDRPRKTPGRASPAQQLTANHDAS